MNDRSAAANYSIYDETVRKTVSTESGTDWQRAVPVRRRTVFRSGSRRDLKLDALSDLPVSGEAFGSGALQRDPRWSIAKNLTFSHAQVRVEYSKVSGRRQFRNADGLVYEYTSQDIHLVATVRINDVVFRMTDRLQGSAPIEASMADFMEASALAAARQHAEVSVPDSASLLLSPTVAAVLLHELLGHGAEEFLPAMEGMSLGSTDLNVTAFHPRRTSMDDLGMSSHPLRIVEHGVVLPQAMGRSRPALLSGLAQAAWHSGPPLARCTHLGVGPGSGSEADVESLTDGILCLESSGGELVGRTAYVGVSRARLVRDGAEIDSISPFTFKVSIDELSAKLLAVGSLVVRTRSGWCVKQGQPLVTESECPMLLLDEMSLLAD